MQTQRKRQATYRLEKRYLPYPGFETSHWRYGQWWAIAEDGTAHPLRASSYGEAEKAAADIFPRAGLAAVSLEVAPGTRL